MHEWEREAYLIVLKTSNTAGTPQPLSTAVCQRRLFPNREDRKREMGGEKEDTYYQLSGSYIVAQVKSVYTKTPKEKE